MFLLYKQVGANKIERHPQNLVSYYPIHFSIYSRLIYATFSYALPYFPI